MTVLADMGARVTAALAPLATPATLTRGAASWPCKVIEEDVDRSVAGTLAFEERVFVVLDLPAGTDPKPQDKLSVGASAFVVQRASRGGAGAVWHVIGKR